MCGINGYVYRAGAVGRLEFADAMNAAMLHRGPDEGGAADAGFAALAMRRLSIVDVRDGHQPMRSEDGRFTLVYNGELYDFAERSGSNGSATRSARARTPKCCCVRGCSEASIASRISTACCVRDRRPLGRKPRDRARPARHQAAVLVAGARWRARILLGTEKPARASVCATQARPALARDAARRPLRRGSVDDARGRQAAARRLRLRWRNGEIEIGRYAEFRIEPEPIDERDALAQLRQRRTRCAVATCRRRARGRVPLRWCRLQHDRGLRRARATAERGGRLQSFSIGFDDPSYDESDLAREVAAHLGTEHHMVRLENSRFELETLDTILDHAGQPVGDTFIPTLAVSRLAASHVKVALSGDGGDELFGGYEYMFWAARMRFLSETTPAPLRRAGSAVLAQVAPMVSGKLATQVRRARKGLELSLHSPLEQFRRTRALWQPQDLAQLCVHDHAGESPPAATSISTRSSNGSSRKSS